MGQAGLHVQGQGGLHVQGQGGLDLLHGGEHRDEEHGNGRHKQVYITIIIIIVFMVIIIVFFIVYHHQHGDERQLNQRFTNAVKLSTYRLSRPHLLLHPGGGK